MVDTGFRILVQQYVMHPPPEKKYRNTVKGRFLQKFCKKCQKSRFLVIFCITHNPHKGAENRAFSDIKALKIVQKRRKSAGPATLHKNINRFSGTSAYKYTSKKIQRGQKGANVKKYPIDFQPPKHRKTYIYMLTSLKTEHSFLTTVNILCVVFFISTANKI